MIKDLPEVAVRRRLRRRRRGRGILNLLLLMLLVAGGYMFLHSPLFHVVDVEIIGANRLSPVEVLDWSGLKGPLLIWQVDTAAAAGNLMSHPAILGAEVTREWPDRVKIRLMERAPVAVFRHFNLWALVDDDGVAFGLDPSPDPGLPKIVPGEMRIPELVLGQPLPGRLRDAARMAGYRRQYGLDWIESIEPAPDGLILRLTGDIIVFFGEVSDQPDRKLAVLQTLWTSWQPSIDDGDHIIEFIDVRNPQRPLVQTTGDLPSAGDGRNSSTDTSRITPDNPETYIG